MGKSNQAVNVMQYKLVASLRYVTGEGNWIFFLKLILAALILIALCYWFFGTEFGKFCAHRKAAFAFTLGAVFIGAILYYLVIALVLWLKMPSDYMKLFSAVVVACFLAVPYMKDTYFKKGRAK